MAAVAVTAAVGVSAATAAKAAKTPTDRAKDIARFDPSARFVPGELLVRFRNEVSPSERAAALAAQGARVARSARIPGLVLARLEPGRGVPTAAAALARRDDVLYAQPNWIHRIAATPNDPRYASGQLWGLHQSSDVDIDAPEAWDVTTGSANVVVGVVDTGIAWQHPDLAANIWTNPDEIAGNGIDDDSNGYVDDVRGWDFVNDDQDPFDDHDHGTHVAGTIGAVGNNGLGIVGVNWNVRLMPLKFLAANGSGSTFDAIQAILYARDEGAKVVNNSWGGGPFEPALQDAFTNSPGVLFLNAAGNGGGDSIGDNNDASPVYPCNYPVDNILCVAATTSTDTRAGFSNYGATTVDLGAPGAGIVSTVPGTGTGPALFTEGWESGTDGWTTGGAPNTWALTTTAKSAGSWSATDSPAGNYADNTDNWIGMTGPVNLTGGSNCSVIYDLRLQAERDYDFFLVEGSTNGVNWTFLDAWTGTSSGSFVQLDTPLGGLSGQPTVFLRFGLLSDETINQDGAYVDEIEVACADPSAGAYDSFNGTSMATPHVAGVAALAWAKNPSVSVATVKSALMNGGDPSVALNGITVSGRRLNAAGTLALIPGGGAGSHVLTVVKSGAGAGSVASSPVGISCGADCTESYAAGTTVTLTATLGASSHFGGWSGCTSTDGMTCTVQMSAAKTVTATFLAGTFADVPPTHPFYGFIEQMYARGITVGCGRNAGGQLLYCPLNQVTRQEMAVFIVRAKGLSLLTPGTPTFSDVPTGHVFYGFIERFYEQGITVGCFHDPSTGERRYCPLDNVTREAMAAFIIRARGLPGLTPSVATFSDVPTGHAFYGFIERFYEQGITVGCFHNPTTGERRFCPLDNVTREAMAAFIIRAFPAP